MNNDLPQVLTLEEVADALRVSTEDVLFEIGNGRLQGIEVAQKWRVTVSAVQQFLQGSTGPAGALRADLNSSTMAGASGGAQSIVSISDLKPSESFEYQWPDKKEVFDRAYKGTLQLGKKSLHVCVGFTYRDAAGTKRRRAIVFFGEPPRLTPVVEFTGTDDFDNTGSMASIIKVSNDRDGGLRQLRPYEPLPCDYSGSDLVIYNHVITGRYATGSMAVLLNQNDVKAMVDHALIRAKLKGWI
jgi:hypothetical protein